MRATLAERTAKNLYRNRDDTIERVADDSDNSKVNDN